MNPQASPYGRPAPRPDIPYGPLFQPDEASDGDGCRIVFHGLNDSGFELAQLEAGLLRRPAAIDPKFFYDAQGCALFGAICALEEYYLTRTEAAIFDRHRGDIAARLPSRAQWVDLGCGDAAKSRDWLAATRAARFIGVDIAHPTLRAALEGLTLEFAATECIGVVTDFSRPLALHGLLAENGDCPAVFFYPGSSIGNLTRPAAQRFLQSVCEHLDEDGCLLIGVDLVKDEDTLEAAYDDALGITAAFNRNVLRVVNRLLDADFRPERFRHEARYAPGAARIEMRLRADGDQVVHIGRHVRRFAAGETILTEYSHKYTPEDFSAMLEATGFSRQQSWTDERGWFGVFLAQP